MGDFKEFFVDSKYETADFHDLEILTVEFPYVSSFRLLYLQELKRRVDVRYLQELKKSSFLFIDRRLLFQTLSKVDGDKKTEESSPLKTDRNIHETITGTQSVDILQDLEQRPDIGGDIDDLICSDTLESLIKGTSFRKPPVINLEGFTLASALNENESEPETDSTQFQPTEELFSETLAKIYVKQHKYDKAIKTFRKLMDKNPEKSVYFADQIDFLEKLIKNL